MDRKKDSKILTVKKTGSLLWPTIIIILLLIYLSPLWLNLDKYPSMYPKNIPNWYNNYYSISVLKDSIFQFHRFPLWSPITEGGRPYINYPLFESLSVFFLLFTNLSENAAIKICWIFYFICGACSMYYLTRYILEYNILGAFFSSLIFSMSGAFAYLFENGFYLCRETLLLPLLFVFFIKSEKNAKFLVLSSFVLSFMLMHVALFFPVIILFLFFISFLKGVSFEKQKLVFNNKYLIAFFMVCGLTLLLSSFKILPMISNFFVNNRISGINYADSIQQANTLELFFRRIFVPESSGAGTMYLGFMPAILCILGAILYFKEMKRYAIILSLFIILSFGPNSPIDLHKLLWHLPVFKSIKEIAKYYTVIIVFVMAILGGKFFDILKKPKINISIRIFLLLIITFIYLDLFNSNIGYFNIFNTKFNYRPAKQEMFYLKALNVDPGDESILMSLIYFLYKRNIGLLGLNYSLRRDSDVVAKYYLLPKYAFLIPSTALLVLPNPEYKSEAYFLDPNNSVKILDISPNIISVKVNMHTKSDRLIINQNFDKSWKSDYGMIEDYNGLLSIRFKTSEKATVRLTYIPKIFFIGLGVSLASFLFSIYLLTSKKYKRPQLKNA